MSGPIPAKYLDEFQGWMDAHNNEDLPDGAWFAVLEDGAEAFMKLKNIKGCRNSAVHQYLEGGAA